MGLTVAVGRNGVMCCLGRSVKCVVIHLVRIGRVLVFVTGPPDVAHKRSVLESRRRNHRIRNNPGALIVPLGAILK